MNYYDHHIGDYDEATSHLTACEDGIYCRLIRKYYSTEKPLPNDIPKLQRWVRARTKEERDAVVAVVEEFFTLGDDGCWHKAPIDERIAAYLAGEPEREAKRKNEDTRLARHRQERAELFATINAAGEHLPWNTKMDDLRKAVERIQSRGSNATSNGKTETPATQPATAPATPATATQKPIANSQTPLPNIQEPVDTPPKPPRRRRGDSVDLVGVEQLVQEGVDPQQAKDWLRVRKEKDLPLTQTAWDGVKAQAAAAGLTVAAAVKTAAENSWGGFKAKWLDEGHVRTGTTSSGRPPTAREQRMQEVVGTVLPRAEPSNDSNTIEGEVRDVTSLALR